MEDFVIKNGVLKKYIFEDCGPKEYDEYAWEPSYPDPIDIEIPEGVVSIGEGAFRNCRAIYSVKIPEGTVSIGRGAFSGCGNLREVQLPKSLKELGDSAFFGCCSLEKIDIPYGVTAIPKEAFCRCGALSKISIPETVTSIGDSAFGTCIGLSYVELPPSVKEVGPNAFSGCIAVIYAPGVSPSCIKDSYERRLFAAGFTDKYFSGAAIDDKIRTSYKKYIGRQRYEFYREAFVNHNLLRYMIAENIIPPEEIDMVAESAVNVSAETRAMLLEYQNRILPPEKREEMEEYDL